MSIANRTTSDIESLAEQAARELLEAEPALKAAPPVERDAAITLALRAKEGSAARLAAAYRCDLSFGDLRNGWIQQRGGAGMHVQGHAIPHLFIVSALKGQSVKSIVAEARAFAESRTSITQSYTALAGVIVPKAVSLSENVDLIPWADVPESRHKTLFCSQLSTSFLPIRARPNSAVKACSVEGQVLFPSHKDATEKIKDPKDKHAVPSVQIHDLLRCITALIARPAASLGGWIQFKEKIADAIGACSYSYSPTFFSHDLWQASSKPVTLDGETIVRVFTLFEEFKPADKQVIQVALDRLSQALREKDGVDRAIDLGIALEVMLLHGIGKNDRGELRFRSSVRGATFLGGKKAERLEVLKLLKDAYDLRSQAVHSGVLKKGKEPKQILENAANTCARIALKLIERRSFPNWDAEVVIGGQ